VGGLGLLNVCHIGDVNTCLPTACYYVNVRDSDFVAVYFAFKQLHCVQQSSCITEQGKFAGHVQWQQKMHTDGTLYLGVCGKCVLLVVNKY
jgi:hypothetical protein